MESEREISVKNIDGISTDVNGTFMGYEWNSWGFNNIFMGETTMETMG